MTTFGGVPVAGHPPCRSWTREVGYCFSTAFQNSATGTVAAGGVYLDPTIAGKVVGTFVGKRDAEDDVPAADLSEREEEVVRLIAEDYSNKEISARLALSVKTVETYKSRSLEKLGMHGRAGIVRYAVQRGWLHAP